MALCHSHQGGHRVCAVDDRGGIPAAITQPVWSDRLIGGIASCVFFLPSHQVIARRGVKMSERLSAGARAIGCLIFACFMLGWPPAGTAQQTGVAHGQVMSGQAPPPVGAGPGEQIIINSDLVTVRVTVTDRAGRCVTGLDKNRFTVFDDKVLQEISFFSDADAPVSVGIIVDVSGSMRGGKIDRAREALSRFIQTSDTSDDYFLIGFNSEAQLLVDRTRDADAVLRQLTRVQPQGQTALYDAVYLGVEKVTGGAHHKRALLLISDGGENDSRHGFGELRSFLAESDVVLYSICVLDQIDLVGKAGGRVQGLLNRLSEATGGRAFYPQSGEEMDETFERIALELRHQYAIGYRPRDFRNDGRWHRVKVKVRPPGGAARLFVRSKEGYYALVRARR